jgi:hypothetical protein
MRRLHLIDKHKYPKYFPFDLVATGTLSFQQKKKRDQKNRERIKKHEEMQKQPSKQKSLQKPKPKQEPEDVDMIDQLTSSMSKLKIPKSISFGHRQPPTLPQHRYKQPIDVIMTEDTHEPSRKSSRKKKNDNEMMDFI